MKEVVVDALVAAKWIVEEEYSADAISLLDCDARYAPDHWQAEAANILWAKVLRGDLTAPDAHERLELLLRAPVVGAPVADLLVRAFAISVANMVTIYDSLYIALAEKRDIPFVTADQRLIRRISTDAALAKRLIWVGSLSD